jgi:hypothetical protein
MSIQQPRYRGEALAGLSALTDDQIAGRIRHATELDRTICCLLRRYQIKHRDNEAAQAAVKAMQAWADVGFASIAAAENRCEVSIFTQTKNV